MEGLCLNIVLITGSIAFLNAETIERIYIRDNNPALKGSNIQLVCEIPQFQSRTLSVVYLSDKRLLPSLSGMTSLTACLPYMCATTVIGRYSFSADSSNVFINITNLNRSEDQKWWTCAIGIQRKDMFLNVTSVPSSIQFENPPNKGQDLAMNEVKLRCITGCSYPQPTMSWFYAESESNSLQVWTSSGNVSDTTLGCSDSERKYSSTLTLPKYTTFPGNTLKTFQFKCGIQSFPGLTQPLYTNFSTNIQFAVKVTNAILKDGTNTVSGQLQVVNGVDKTLTCDTGESRPAATIVWYIDSEEKQRSSSKTFTFKPDNSAHNKQVYCKAFNIQKESAAVISYKLQIYIQVQVSWATLKDGSSKVSEQIQVEIGESKTLTCETDESRPLATIVWYIELRQQQRSTSHTFTFQPEDIDHNRQVYCKAFNIQPESEAVSSNKTHLHIKGMPSSPRSLYFFGQYNGANIFIFVGGHNGGRLQTYFVETRANGTFTWTEQLKFNETNRNYLQNEESLYRFNIMGLLPGVYDIRVRAGNEIGLLAEDLALTIQFTVYQLEQENSKQAQINHSAAIVGGSLSFVIVGILVAGVFIMRKVTWKRKVDKKTKGTAEGSTYDSLRTEQEFRTTYSTLTPKTVSVCVSTDKAYENVKSQQHTSEVL